MIGVDTNVLVRLFIDDEPQSAKSLEFFSARSASDPAFVSLLVAAEFTWVLKKKYKKTSVEIGRALQSMLDSDDFVLEARDSVEWALANFTRSKIDFSDLLIARSSELARAPRIVTFDKEAARHVPGMELLK